MTASASPARDELEVNLFGPGFGESSVIHVGDGKWIIIDSCIDSESNRPAALSYLDGLGVDVSADVVLVLVTHFHDDHIRGISEVAERCTNAVLCISAAFENDEFLTVLSAYNNGYSPVGSGVSELYKLLKLRKEQGRTLKHAIVDRIVYERKFSDLQLSVRAFSPSDEQFRRFLASVQNLIPTKNETRRRMPNDALNHYSVVARIDSNDNSLLFGGDLEQTPRKDCGWNAVVEAHVSSSSPQSCVFKVPHHGSENGHNDDVWLQMLIQNCWAILTPFNRGKKKLPSVEDRQRIFEKTDNAFLTAPHSTARTKKVRSSAVERSIREVAGRIRTITWNTGHIRLRKNIDHSHSRWSVELFSGAQHLGNNT